LKPQVVCLPGAVAPAAQRYAPLLAHAGGDADLHLKDLELYREAAPPAGYSVELELSAIDRFADERGLEAFHLLGYSGGGFISLAYAGTRPERLQSLAVFEPAGIPGRLSEEEQHFSDELVGSLRGLDGPAFMEMFVRKQLKVGVAMPPPPPGPPSPEMLKRPAGIAALTRAFPAYSFDRAAFMACDFPVFHAYGDQTREVEALRAGILARLFGDIRVRRFKGVHHFVPPEHIYTPAYVRALQRLWSAAELSLE
jgi:pimeloyl-ACP methyl ester carboxylesterase